MKFGIRRSGAGIRRRFQVLAPGASLRKRVAYSLAIVRLILVPVIFLAIFYLLEIGWIVDRIVSFDAPAATLAQQASITMLEARHAERNYLLLYDPSSLQANRDSIQKIEQIMSAISDLQPSDETMTQETLAALGRYNERFEAAVTVIGQPGQAPADRIDAVLMTYEKDLDNLLKSERYKTRSQLVDELRGQGAGDGGAPEAVLGRGQLHGAGKLAIALLQVEDGRLCAQRGQHIEQRGARRIEA